MFVPNGSRALIGIGRTLIGVTWQIMKGRTHHEIVAAEGDAVTKSIVARTIAG